MSNIAYIRVNTEGEEIEQIAALKPFDIDKWFIEKASGMDKSCPKFKEMMNYIREGDTIYIKDFSRLSRSTIDLLNIIDELINNQVNLVSLKENLDTSTPTGELMLTMVASINQFERKNLLDRQREGIRIAKGKGIYKGRKPIEKPLNWHEIYKLYQTKEITANEAMKKLNLRRNTFYKFVKKELNNYVPVS